MKILVCLTLLLWTPNALLVSCRAQDCDLKFRYEKMLSTYNDSMLYVANMYQNDMSMRGNNAALIIESIDTLNKDEIVLTTFVEGTVLESERKWMGMSGGEMTNDTLNIYIGYLMAKEHIDHVLFKGAVRTYFTEWYKYDNFLKLKKEDTPTNRLKIEVQDHEFEICQEENIYYGYSKMTIEPYFRQDKYNHNQFLQIQRNYEYYFKFEIQ